MIEDVMELAGWLTAVVSIITGAVVTMRGWSVREKQALELAQQQDVHDCIERVTLSLTDFEDAAYEFWSNKDSTIRVEHLLLLHARIRRRLTQLAQLTPFKMPNHALAELRKQATLDAETAVRPLPSDDKRLIKLSRATEKILDMPALDRHWHTNKKGTL